jgi:potassium channel subfamily K
MTASEDTPLLDTEFLRKQVSEGLINAGEDPDLEAKLSFQRDIQRSLFIILGFITTGAIVFSLTVEDLTISEGTYLAVISFTTVGFGDFAPESNFAKIFAMAYVFLGLSIIMSIISIMTDRLESYEKAEAKKRQLAMLDPEKENNSGTNDDASKSSASSSPAKPEKDNFVIAWLHTNISPMAWPIFIDVMSALSHIAATLAVGMVAFSFIFQRLSVIDSLYMSFMTITTVGYGDIVPDNDISRWFTIFYAFGGTIVMANSLNSLNSVAQNYERSLEEAAVLRERIVTAETFRAMDKDGSNSISREEFILHRLTELGMIDQDLCERAGTQVRDINRISSTFPSFVPTCWNTRNGNT